MSKPIDYDEDLQPVTVPIELEDQPPLNRLDLTTIALALETHERVHTERNKGNPENPGAIAARRTLAKVRAHLEAESSK